MSDIARESRRAASTMVASAARMLEHARAAVVEAQLHVAADAFHAEPCVTR